MALICYNSLNHCYMTYCIHTCLQMYTHTHNACNLYCFWNILHDLLFWIKKTIIKATFLHILSFKIWSTRPKMFLKVPKVQPVPHEFIYRRIVVANDNGIVNNSEFAEFWWWMVCKDKVWLFLMKYSFIREETGFCATPVQLNDQDQHRSLLVRESWERTVIASWGGLKLDRILCTCIFSGHYWWQLQLVV